MTITLRPELERRLQDEARLAGLRDASALVERLVERHLAALSPSMDAPTPADLRQTEAWWAVQKMKGTATGGLTADAIMAETRSEI